jgi:hypothetical protein
MIRSTCAKEATPSCTQRSASVVDLNDAHQRNGVEEMQPGDTVRMPAAGGDRRDRQGRGVGGQDGVGSDHLLEFEEERLLGIETLDYRLDHHVAVRHVGQRPDHPDARPISRNLRRIQLALVRKPLPGLPDGIDRALRCLGVGVVQEHAGACLCHHLGDPPSHHAGPDDADLRCAIALGLRARHAGHGSLLVHRGIIFDFPAAVGEARCSRTRSAANPAQSPLPIVSSCACR